MSAHPNWAHDALAEDLAHHLVAPNRMVWVDMQLGRSGSPRPDVYVISKSYVSPAPTAYECKVSREDFRADVTAGKWQSYLDFAHAVVFAAPAGLLSKDDIPPMCGLIVRHENCWRLAKKAIPVPKQIDQEALLKLLIDGVNREGPKERAKRWHHEDTFREFSKRFGSTAARYVSDAASIDRQLEAANERRIQILQRAEEEARAIRERAAADAPQQWTDLLSVLELETGASAWDVRQAIRNIKNQKDGGDEGAALRQVLNVLARTVRNHQHFIEAPESRP